MAPSDEAREFFFSWQGAARAWDHLRVLSFRGHEALSELYWFEIELHRDADVPDVNVEDLIGAPAALKMMTRTEPGWRVVHGVISSAVELGDVTRGGRYRVLLSPPFMKHTIARVSFIYLEKTLRTIVEKTLERAWGPAMQKASGAIAETSGDLTSYSAPKMTFEWRVLDVARLDDPEARPYCVEYLESAWAFVSRLLEEEGIAYHFEHSDAECRVVFTDADASRITVKGALGPTILGREIPSWHAGGRLRPRSVNLDDYNWRNPPMALGAESRSAPTDFATMEWPGRYEASAQTGVTLANAREERFDTERRYSSAEGRCRLLSAGSVFQLEHPKDKFDGQYLVTAIEHEGYELGWFADRNDMVPYRQRFECAASGGAKPTIYRPARLTPQPRIYGTQTAIVTAEPGSNAEINVGGPSDIGCVRVRFLWDAFNSLRENEPTSCWIRVSQFFAGSRDHGALWHPRVGDEVIVEFLHGDPDRPLVTGRVYNGTNLPPHSPAGNPTVRPTYSAIHSLTSPYNGNYNKLSFEDLQGEELIHVHAARDETEDIERNYTRNTKAHDAENAGTQSIHVGEWQTIDVGTWQRITTGTDQTIEVGANQTIQVKANQTIGVGGTETITVKGNQTINAKSDQYINVTGLQKMEIGGNQSIHVVGKSGLLADAMIIKRSPIVKIGGFAIIHEKAGSIMFLESGGSAVLKAPETIVNGTSEVTVLGGDVKVLGPTVDIHGVIKIHGPTVTIEGAIIDVKAATVNITGDGVVNVKGGTINLNC
jgi:type VI secretion system secreted protein VgrG